MSIWGRALCKSARASLIHAHSAIRASAKKGNRGSGPKGTVREGCNPGSPNQAALHIRCCLDVSSCSSLLLVRLGIRVSRVVKSFSGTACTSTSFALLECKRSRSCIARPGCSSPHLPRLYDIAKAQVQLPKP